MRIVVTGGAGFLGSHVCDRLIAEGHTVVAVDNLATGRVANIEHLFGNEAFRFDRHDVTNYLWIPGAVDVVIHMASPASPIDYLNLPIQTLKVGSLGTHNALGLAREKGARFVLASTSEVYGDPERHPQVETYWGHVNPVGPRGVYDEAKRFAEAMTMAYHRAHGMDVRIARIFNTYGPRLRPSDGRVVSSLLAQAMAGEPLTIFGSGEQTRSFCYVDDLVEGLWALIGSDYVGPVNLGNPDEYSINELARIVKEITGSSSDIVHLDLPEDDPARRRPDISLARRVTAGWEPRVPLREGLRLTADWLARNPD
ncbi:MAG TPA: SDR family oxidoreductase [Acidimicrobiales bacterium]|nr:SDR family oxidoreductase [Acidimicrobiales bacterium]